MKQSDVTALEQLGLSNDEARVYVLLANESAMTAREIAARLSVSASNVYRLAEELKEQGFLQQVKASPKTYQAVPAALAVKNLAKKKSDSTVAVGRSLIASLSQAHKYDQHKMEVLLGKDANFEKYCTLSADTKRIVKVISVGEKVPEALFKEVESAIKRGVEHRFLFHRNDQSNVMYIQRWKAMGVEVRHLPSEGYHLNLFDADAAILSASNPEDSAERTNIVMYNASIISALDSYFDSQWEISEVV